MNKKDITVLPTLGYNHLEVGDPNNTKPYRVCGAPTRNEATIHEFCQNSAGYKTSHLGVGRCNLHGGAAPMRSNRYSKLWRGRMAEIARATLENDDTDPLDLLAELDVQRVVLSVLLDRLNGNSPANSQDDTRSMAAVRDYLTSPQLSARKRKQLEQKGRELNNSGNSVVSVDNMDTVGEGGDTINALQGYPVDNPLTEFSSLPSESGSPIKEINMELIEQIRQALNDVVGTVGKVVAMRNQTAITKSEVTYLLLLLKEGMNKFVPKENHEAYVRWLMDNIPGGKKVVGEGIDE